jgi:phosphoribosylaminoimidazole-succinocarboxamide synthase
MGPENMFIGKDFLTKVEIERLIDNYILNEGRTSSTQGILDSNAVPRIDKYVVRPGKVSDSIFGGRGEFTIERKKYEQAIPARPHDVKYFTKEVDGKDKEFAHVEFENPPLNAHDGTPLRIMVRTQRISTHDVNRGEIPFKDQILASNHNYMRRLLTPAIGTSQYDVEGLPDNAVVIVSEDLKEDIDFENVLRAYMAKSSTSTSLYVHYMNGEREFCGHKLPEGLFPNGPLPYVMDTPSTKSAEHDISVSPEQLFEMKVCTPEIYSQVRNGSVYAFGKVDEFFRPKGVIAVDTKTEHGINKKGKIVSKDEIWTMDSSRFWLVDDYNTQIELFLKGKEEELIKYIKETQPGIKEKEFIVNGRIVPSPRSLSKEFARGFSEGENGYTDEQRAQIAVRYVEGIQSLLGRKFEPDLRPRDVRVISGLELAVSIAA